MEWIKTHPWTVGIVIAGFVVVIGALIYAFATHKKRMAARDKGFMKTEGGESKLWLPSDLPVALWVEADMDNVWWDALQFAVQKWNESVGKKVFMKPMRITPAMTKKMSKGNVLVEMHEIEAGFMQSDHGTTILRHNPETGEIHSAVVKFPKGSISIAPYIAIHELGHVLGLDHDETKDSIMYHKLMARLDPGKITDADAKRVEETYFKS